jgi:hypothetical protein
MKLKRYRLTLEDVQRLSKVWSVRISRVRLICTLALCALLFMGLGASIVFLSPLKRRMPGFMTEMQRQDVIGALARMDTLGLVMASNQAYIDNVKTLMDTSREPADSARASVRIGALPLDSLKTASPAERRFVASMAEREKYNLNVLSPVAADAVIFSDPSDGGIIVGESRTASMLQVIMPAGEGVNAIADGYVVDRTYDSGEGTYSLMVQGHRGFLTRYSHLGTPLVDKGDPVLSGQRISLAPERRTRRNTAVGIEMWREGTRLIPGDYLMRPRVEGQVDIAAPRGRE